ncbi:ABC transporter ATP-binding protein [Sulfuracidifex metallicus]|jgi:ABC-2 type transport system ATP-binding protein|uniref:ATP-binding cassette domain-containing protein n=1 Tax=Sulfuracidifex metallicus DSM 6482 = JCM 9184 TaxID=523847 RepID=A0A6A9QNT5_SULME|nr:ABC transporter ATP-binding protein [Sulfuracidifex metallicus]MCY0849421.1 ABC transporter ATP-binding protein [Sulfuracidifex metallicus]MUN29408.1 ATP-binding cassette domain-containing protein [Sulfuracidifex metallicus DSM 6482 = JCM 9184]WOE50080.1 ABC transporter ATP-binding protein [Sulfuracidifex metallicus DSM 6482 = JCM 9184]
MSNELCIEVSNVTKSYGNINALNGLTFSIACGGKFALLGPNGAGKSTTLKLLMGFLKPDRGSVRIKGLPPCSVEVRKITGYLPENAQPYRTMTVRDNLQYIAALRGVDMNQVYEIVDLLDLRKYWNYKASQLSQGNLQKLSIALAIMHKPSILLMDEPLNYLDIPTQESVISILSKISSTMLVSTHIMSVAGRLTDNVIMINKGQVVWMGTFEDIKRMGTEDEPIESIVAKLMRG